MSVCRYFELATGTLHLLGSFNGTEQTKGACLLPKRGVDVMGCEMDRLFRLTESVNAVAWRGCAQRSLSAVPVQAWHRTLSRGSPALRQVLLRQARGHLSTIYIWQPGCVHCCGLASWL